VWTIEYSEGELFRTVEIDDNGHEIDWSIHPRTTNIKSQFLHSLVAGPKLWSWEVNTQDNDLKMTLTWMDRMRKFDLSSQPRRRDDEFGEAAQCPPTRARTNERVGFDSSSVVDHPSPRCSRHKRNPTVSLITR